MMTLNGYFATSRISESGSKDTSCMASFVLVLLGIMILLSRSCAVVLCCSQVDFYFSNYSSSWEVKSAVGKVRYGGYEANLHLALSLARNSVFVTENGARLGEASVSKLIVVVTDNPSVNKSATLREAELLRDAGIGLVTIGVGTYLDRYELSAVASYPYTDNMFVVNTVRRLSNFTEPVKRIICGGSYSSVHFSNIIIVHC